MKTYAKYFHKSATSDKLVPMCGSDSVCQIDGRMTYRAYDVARSHAQALNNNLGKDIKGFVLYRGKTQSEALNNSPLSSMQTV